MDYRDKYIALRHLLISLSERDLENFGKGDLSILESNLQYAINICRDKINNKTEEV